MISSAEGFGRITPLIRTLILFIVALRPCASARGQVKSPAQLNQQKAEELLNSKKYSFQDLLNGKPGAVANAKEIFALSDDPNTKLRAGSVLLRIGRGDQVQFDYLTAEARKSLDYANSMPWPTLYDKDGNIVPEKPNPEFLKWCEAHKLNAWDTYEAAYYQVPVSWYFLAAAGDPRAYDLLTYGLHSKNVMIVGRAAEGLARLQASQAVDEIIAAGSRAPLETRSSIGQALLCFPDAKAQAAADELIKDKKVLALWRAEAKSKGTKAFFPY